MFMDGRQRREAEATANFFEARCVPVLLMNSSGSRDSRWRFVREAVLPSSRATILKEGEFHRADRFCSAASFVFGVTLSGLLTCSRSLRGRRPYRLRLQALATCARRRAAAGRCDSGFAVLIPLLSRRASGIGDSANSDK